MILRQELQNCLQKECFHLKALFSKAIPNLTLVISNYKGERFMVSPKLLGFTSEEEIRRKGQIRAKELYG